jgi:hypothetical protein
MAHVESITMSMREIDRLNTIQAVIDGHLRASTAASRLQLTKRRRSTAPTDSAVFRAYVSQVLAPTLAPGDIVVMDNLGAHKVKGVRETIEAAGTALLYLPPYSPGHPLSLAGPSSRLPCAQPKRVRASFAMKHSSARSAR